MGKIVLPIYQPARKVQPQELLCLIHGEKQIAMAGFAIDTAPPAPLMLGAANVPANLNHSELMAELRTQGNKSRKVLLLSVLLAGAAILVGLMTWLGVDRREIPLAPIEWSIQSINPRGLIVASGDSIIEVPVGAKMPNGETLLSTSSATAAYTTSAGTMRLSKPHGK